MKKTISFPRRIFTAFTRFLHPNHGSCIRCGISWGWRNAVENLPMIALDWEHMTVIIDQTHHVPGISRFCLCRRCWNEIPERERFEYFIDAMAKNHWGAEARIALALWKMALDLQDEVKKIVPYSEVQ